MNYRNLILHLLLLISGCAHQPIPTVNLNPLTVPPADKEFKFEAPEASTLKKSYCFQDCQLKSLVVDVANDYGVFISFADGLGDKTISGTYKDITVIELLNSVALQLNVKCSWDGKLFYLSENDFSKKFVLVGRSSLSEDKLQSFITSLVGGEENKINFNVVGNKFFIHDTADNLKIYASALRDVDEFALRSYVAEVFFIRVNNSDLLDLQAKMDATGIDILKQSWSLKDLFNCYVDADAHCRGQHIIQRPILYCSEGQPAELNVGTDLTLEKKAISTEGYTSTTGWQTFSDGLQIKLLIRRMRDSVYQADFDLTISKYDDAGDTVVGVLPRVDKTTLTQTAVVVPSAEPILLGSLSSKLKKNGYGFISANASRSEDSILVFLRLREIDISQQNLFNFDKTALDGI